MLSAIKCRVLAVPAPALFRSNASRIFNMFSSVAPPALAGGEVTTSSPR